MPPRRASCGFARTAGFEQQPFNLAHRTWPIETMQDRYQQEQRQRNQRRQTRILQEQHSSHTHRENQNNTRQQRSRRSRQKPNLGAARAQMRFNTRVLLVPPKPKELDTATSTGMSRDVLAQ